MGEREADVQSTSEATVPCPECGAANPPDAKFCEACGVRLVAASRGSSDAPARRAGGPDARRRRAAEKELGVQHLMQSARQTVANLRSWLGVLTVAMALLALLVQSPLSQALVLGMAATFALGAWLLPQAPLQWIVGLAGLETVFVALILIGGGSPGWIHYLVTLSLWAAVPRIARAQRVVRENRGLFGSNAFVSTTAQIRKDRRARGASNEPGEIRGRARARVRAGRSGSLESALLVVGAIAVVTVAGILGYRAIAAGESIDARAVAFRDQWNADQHGALAAMMVPEQRATFWPKVERILRREGWDTDLPDLGQPDFFERREQRAEVHFAITDRPGAVVKTYWTLEGSLWKVATLRFAGLRG